MDTDIVM
jgi:hypothetical protein